SQILGNDSGGDGGGIRNNNYITIEKSTIFDNFSQGANGGGGIANDGTLYVINSTISGNRANEDGGGLWLTSGPSYFNNVTIADNHADEDDNSAGSGGGLFNAGSSITILNSLLAQNFVFSSASLVPDDCKSGTSIVSEGYNLVGTADGCSWTSSAGDQTGTNSSPINPKIGPLAGKSTQTHPLLPGSPAIDAGNPITPGIGMNACRMTDQRSVLRPGSIACDIGSYEAASITGLTFIAPSSALISETVVITGVIVPFRSAIPITYTWTADEQSPIVSTSGLTESVLYSWTNSGFKTISLEVENAVSTFSSSFEIIIFEITGSENIYLPMIMVPR
ncbi:MAG: choice-of-anchor Q domain-containing protein, partial [Anaerolineales bacterium]|nr:choice-of-anchor Q domain-containing protein [Anaerolineales bacterium]